jgi:hypothetical protein
MRRMSIMEAIPALPRIVSVGGVPLKSKMGKEEEEEGPTQAKVALAKAARNNPKSSNKT